LDFLGSVNNFHPPMKFYNSSIFLFSSIFNFYENRFYIFKVKVLSKAPRPDSRQRGKSNHSDQTLFFEQFLCFSTNNNYQCDHRQLLQFRKLVPIGSPEYFKVFSPASLNLRNKWPFQVKLMEFTNMIFIFFCELFSCSFHM